LFQTGVLNLIQKRKIEATVRNIPTIITSQNTQMVETKQNGKTQTPENKFSHTRLQTMKSESSKSNSESNTRTERG
jgi:hypothetical protein